MKHNYGLHIVDDDELKRQIWDKVDKSPRSIHINTEAPIVFEGKTRSYYVQCGVWVHELELDRKNQKTPEKITRGDKIS